MLYKGIECEEILKSGNVELIDKMVNSVSSKKSRNRGNVEFVKECEEILEKAKEWKMQNGFVKSAKRGKYDGVDIMQMSDEDLAGMYESLASRRCYYAKVDKKKYGEIAKRYEEVKAERMRRKVKKMQEMLK